MFCNPVQVVKQFLHPSILSFKILDDGDIWRVEAVADQLGSPVFVSALFRHQDPSINVALHSDHSFPVSADETDAISRLHKACLGVLSIGRFEALHRVGGFQLGLAHHGQVNVEALTVSDKLLHVAKLGG